MFVAMDHLLRVVAGGLSALIAPKPYWFRAAELKESAAAVTAMLKEERVEVNLPYGIMVRLRAPKRVCVCVQLHRYGPVTGVFVDVGPG